MRSLKPREQPSQFEEPLHWKRAPLTLGLIAVCAVVFLGSWVHCARGTTDPLYTTLWSMGGCSASLERVGALSLPLAWVEGQWWRVATAGLAHGSWVHVALNMWSVWVIGPWAERAWGSARATVVFVVASLGGCLASVAWAEAPLVVGASAGILGLAGGLWVSRGWGAPDVRARIDAVSTRGLGTMLGLMLLLGFVVPVIAQAGHVGGLVFGVGLGWLFSRPSSGVGRALGLSGALAGLVAMGLLAQAPRWRVGYFEFRGYYLLEKGRDQAAAEALSTALERRGTDPVLLNAVAYALAEAGTDLDWAQSLVLQALALEPDNPDYLDTRGWIACRSGRARAGLRDIRRASKLTDGQEAEIEAHLDRCADARVP